MTKRFTLLLTLLVSMFCASFAEETKNDHGVIVTPADGIEHSYSVDGIVISPVGFGVSHNPATGVLKMVYCSDGTVYMQQPLLRALKDIPAEDRGWIKGTQQDNHITFAGGQSVAAYTHPVTGKTSVYHLGMATIGSEGGVVEATPDAAASITFQVLRDGKVLQLLGTTDTAGNFNNHALCTYYTTEIGDITAYYWDYATRLVLDNSDQHNPAVVPPADAPRQDWLLGAYDHDPRVDRPVAFNAQLIVEGEEVYLGGFSFYGRDQILDTNRWIKGHKEGSRLVFPKEQYIMTSEDKFDLYVYGVPKGSTAAEGQDFVLTLDAAGNYVAENDLCISYEKMGAVLDYAERLTDYVLYAYNTPEEYAIHLWDFPADEYIHKFYDRHGLCVNANSVNWPTTGQEGLLMEIYYAPDGKTVYIQDPLSLIGLEVFVKGTIEEDGKIHVPLMQWLQRDEEYGDVRMGVFQLQWIDRESVQYTYNLLPYVQEVTFTIDEDGDIYMDALVSDQEDGEMPPTYMLGATRGTYEYVWAGVADAYSVYTETTAPEGITSLFHTPGNETYYDFSGRRLSVPAGLHIASGRKVIR